MFNNHEGKTPSTAMKRVVPVGRPRKKERWKDKRKRDIFSHRESEDISRSSADNTRVRIIPECA